MPDLLRRSSVQNLGIVGVGANAVSPAPIQGTWPIGDTLVKTLVLRYSGVVTVTLGGGALSVVKQQIARLLANLTFGTDKHQDIISQGMDGLSLMRMLQVSQRRDPYYLDVPASASGAVPIEAIFRIPLGDDQAARMWDSALDLLVSQPYLRQYINAVNANTFGVITGGAGTSIVFTSLNLEVSVEKYTGPFMDSAGKPAFASVAPLVQRFFGIQGTAITGTKPQMRIDLPYGDRVYKKIVLMPRDSVTLAERADIIGVNDQDRVSLILNSVPIFENLEVQQLMHDSILAAAPASLAGVPLLTLDFDKLFSDGGQRGARLANDLQAVSDTQVPFYLLIDTTLANGGSPYLYVGMECEKPLQQAAKRPAQIAPHVAAAVAASKSGA